MVTQRGAPAGEPQTKQQIQLDGRIHGQYSNYRKKMLCKTDPPRHRASIRSGTAKPKASISTSNSAGLHVYTCKPDFGKTARVVHAHRGGLERRAVTARMKTSDRP
jgi:hypothetical protein